MAGVFGTVNQAAIQKNINDNREVFGSSAPQLLTALPVPTITISKLYFDLADLKKNILLYADAVDTVIVVADTVSISEQVKLLFANICRA